MSCSRVQRVCFFLNIQYLPLLHLITQKAHDQEKTVLIDLHTIGNCFIQSTAQLNFNEKFLDTRQGL